MHRSQVLAYLLTIFLLGVFIGSYWAIAETMLLTFTAFGILVVGISVYHRTFGITKTGIAKRKIGVLIGCCILVMLYGIYRFQQFDANHSLVTQFNDRTVSGKGVSVIVRGYVAGDVRINTQEVQVPIWVKEVITPGRKIFTDEKILVRLRAADAYTYGDTIAFQGTLTSPKNFDEFDYVTYLKKQGIRSIMPFPEEANLESLTLSQMERISILLHRKLQQIKNKFESAVQRSMPEPEAAYVQGILLGSRTNIPQALRDAFATTGTSHILAISGYNIAILAEMIMAGILFWFRRRVAFWITMVVIILFVIITGGSASVVRAAIMGILLLFAQGYGRLYSSKHAIALAAAVMVFFNPFVLVFDIGFQLSFLAVLGLIYLYPIFKYYLRRWRESDFKDLILMTLAAQTMVLPALIGYFHSLPLLSLAANILVLPFVPMLMGLGFAAGLAGILVMFLGRIVGVFAWALAHYQISVIEWFAALPMAAVAISVPRTIIFGIYGLIFIGLWRFYRTHAYV